MLHLIARVAAAATLAAAAYAVLPAAPASAAACPTADGVTVVVDFHELGGGVQTACVPDGGGDKASSLFGAAGFALSYVQRQPGFVCRVAGKPAENPCVNTPPANAYWGLYWSDGTSGSWTYSSSGVGGLSVPDGGYVAFSWNSGSSAPPGTSPAPHPDPEPTQQPSSQPSSQPTKEPTKSPGGPSSSSATPGATPSSGSPSASESATPGKRKKSSGASASPTPSESEAATPSETATDDTVVPASADPPDAGDDGLPAWVAPVVILVLFGAAGGVAVVRRRRGAGTA